MSKSIQLSTIPVKRSDTTVYKRGGTVRDMTTAEEKKLSSQRYVQLVRDLYEEYGANHGAQRQVAIQLRVAPDYISKILRGDRTTVGVIVIERAINKFGVARDYFYKPSTRRVWYGDYLSPGGKAVNPAFHQWLSSTDHKLTYGEYEALAALPMSDPAPWKYQAILATMRAHTGAPRGGDARDTAGGGDDDGDGSGLHRSRPPRRRT